MASRRRASCSIRSSAVSVETARFLLDPVQRRDRPFGLLPRQRDGQLQPGQRRAQFMRHVVNQLAARKHQLLDLFGHAVKIARQIGDFVAPPPHPRGQTHPQIAARKPVEPLTQRPDRQREIKPQNGRKDQSGQDAADIKDQGRGKVVLVEPLRQAIENAPAAAIGRGGLRRGGAHALGRRTPSGAITSVGIGPFSKPAGMACGPSCVMIAAAICSSRGAA